MLSITLLVTAFLLSGCNTLKGFGSDIHKLGDNMEHMFD